MSNEISTDMLGGFDEPENTPELIDAGNLGELDVVDTDTLNNLGGGMFGGAPVQPQIQIEEASPYSHSQDNSYHENIQQPQQPQQSQQQHIQVQQNSNQVPITDAGQQLYNQAGNPQNPHGNMHQNVHQNVHQPNMVQNQNQNTQQVLPQHQPSVDTTPARVPQDDELPDDPEVLAHLLGEDHKAPPPEAGIRVEEEHEEEKENPQDQINYDLKTMNNTLDEICKDAENRIKLLDEQKKAMDSKVTLLNKMQKFTELNIAKALAQVNPKQDFIRKLENTFSRQQELLLASIDASMKYEDFILKWVKVKMDSEKDKVAAYGKIAALRKGLTTTSDEITSIIDGVNKQIKKDPNLVTLAQNELNVGGFTGKKFNG